MALITDNKRKYKPLEKVLTDINKQYISLSEEECKRNNAILKELLNVLTTTMKKKDNLFQEMYTRIFYGGSYYDGLRVGQPDEFDLDLLLSLPKLAGPVITTSNVPGYVNLQLKNLLELYKQNNMANRYKGLDKLLDDKHYLDNQKVRQWIERVVNLTLNSFEKQGAKSILKIPQGTFFAKIHKAGPAFTLKVNGNINGKEIILDIDLVPCFEFTKEHWPKDGFKQNPITNKPNFFIVPKPMKDSSAGDKNRHWRLSFQEQEREIMDKKQYLKPTIKLLKKMRDVLGHKSIASYYIKTVVLWNVGKMPQDFWSSSLSNVFMTILKQYYECLKSGRIQYYWNQKNDLIKGVQDITKLNFANKIKAIIDDVDKHLDDPAKHDINIIAKYILTPLEYTTYKTSSLSLK